jgi:hypothetical protein
MKEKSASLQIDDIIKQYGGWKGELLASIRNAIKQADPEVIEEIKWKMAKRPEGLPVWSHDGVLCFAETWKDNIKLLFPKGAHFKDTHKAFNARLESKDIRAIEFREDHKVDVAAITALIVEGVAINKMKTRAVKSD